jgi:WhiB family transcriptional regulator, redox-sensing transcriptional regulator
VTVWAWLDEAACLDTDPELFYEFSAKAYRAARQTCAGCPVRAECLDAAMQQEAPLEDESRVMNRDRRHGIRAGLTGFQRWRLAYK